MTHRRWNTFEITYGPEAYIEVEILAQSHVYASGALSHGGHQRTLDCKTYLTDSLEGAFRQIGPEEHLGLAACIGFFPGYGLGTAIGFIHGCIQDRPHDGSDLRTDSISFYVNDFREINH